NEHILLTGFPDKFASIYVFDPSTGTVFNTLRQKHQTSHCVAALANLPSNDLVVAAHTDAIKLYDVRVPFAVSGIKMIFDYFNPTIYLTTSNDHEIALTTYQSPFVDVFDSRKLTNSARTRIFLGNRT